MEQAVNIPPILTPNPVPAMGQPQTSIPSTSTGGVKGTDTLSAILGQVAAQASAKLPPQYISQGQGAQPHVHENTPYQQRDEHVKPITNQATSISQARNESAWNKLANVVGMAGQELQKRKTDLLKNDIQKVMQSQQNIANAQAVLANDPNNAMAKKVLEQNKTNMESILSDPKKQKAMAKAFDVSFIDPEKNKTPEHQAMQAAAKAVKDAGAFNSNNPDEHKVAQASQTPNADKLMSKAPVGIQENPQYTAAYKQQQDAQKQLNQYVLPKVIQAQMEVEKQKMQSDAAYGREQLRSATSMKNNLDNIIGRASIADAQMANQYRMQSMRDTQAYLDTKMRVDATLEIAKNKLVDKQQQDKAKNDSLAGIDKHISAITTQQKTLAQNMAEAKTNDPDNTSRQKQLQMALDYTDVQLGAYQQLREDSFTKAYGRIGMTNPNAKQPDKSESKSGVSAFSTFSPPEVVGKSDSDEDVDEDEDSDDY